ncbi:hypothetical protein V8F06_014875, partial [Rhypophila decipiens]
MAQVVPAGGLLVPQDKGPHLQYGLATPSPEPDARTGTGKPNNVDVPGPVDGGPLGPGVSPDKDLQSSMQNPMTDAESGPVATIPNKDIPIPTVEKASDPNSDSESSDEEYEKKKPTKEAEEAIGMILQKKSDLWGILGVEPGSQETIKTVNAFKQLGCLLHPNYIEGKNTEKAFKKLMKLAKDEIHALAISQVRNWDGEDTLIEEDDSMEVDNNNERPPPPEHIIRIYEEATPAVAALQLNVQDKAALDFINTLNDKIKQQNKELGFKENDWHVNESALTSNFSWAQKLYEDINKNPESSEADKSLEEIKTALDALVEKSHYPKSWSLPDNFRDIAQQVKEAAEAEAEAARKRAEAEVEAAKQKAEAEAAKQKAEVEAEKNKAVGEASSAKGQPAAIKKGVRVEYPWETMETQHGELIIGIRRRGIGHQVCVEVEEPDGRMVRTLKSGSEVGLRDTAKYKSMGGYKDLAKGQSDWSFKNREDFGELLFVTTTNRKSIYGNSRNPGADCCVRFLTKGIHILSVSSFERVLGRKDAREEIMKVCERDGICAPWAVEMITEDNDP